MNDIPSIELHETYSEQDTASIHQNMSCQHNTILTDRTFQNLPRKRKLSGDRFSFPKKTPKELCNNASVTTADATDFRCSLQDICPNGSQIPHTVNILDKDETKYAVDPSQEIPEDVSIDKSLSMIQSNNNQDIPMIDIESVIPVNLETQNNNIPDSAPVPENSNIQIVLPIVNAAEANGEIGRQSRAKIAQISEFYLLMGCFYLFAYLSLNNLIPYFALLIFFSFVCVIKVISNLIHAEHHERYRKALDWISVSMVVIAASIRIVVPDLPLIPFAFPGFICTILFWQIARPRTSYLRKENVVALRFLFWAQILLITLKIDGYISSWNFVFLMLFYVFVFIMSFSVGIFLIATVYICQTFRMRSIDHTIIGLLWDFMNTLFAWIWGFGILSVINKLDNQHAPFLVPCIVLGFVHVIVLGIYTLVFKNTLAAHLVITFGLNNNQGEQTGNQRYSFETARENIAYLVRVSSTYFTRVDEGFKIQDKQQVQTWKQKIFNSKIEKYYHKNLRSVKKNMNKELNENDIVTNLKSNSFHVRESKNISTVFADQDDKAITSKMSYSQDDIDIVKEIKRPSLKNSKSEEGNDENQCIICFSAPSDAVFMGCGHGGICHSCALEVWKRGDTCVFCRNDIDEILRVSYIPGVSVAKVIEGTKRNVVFE